MAERYPDNLMFNTPEAQRIYKLHNQSLICYCVGCKSLRQFNEELAKEADVRQNETK